MKERTLAAYIVVRDDISTSYVSHLEIAMVLARADPNNSDLVFCRERTAIASAARERIPATLIAKTTALAYVSGMNKRDQAGESSRGFTAGKIQSLEFVKSSMVPSHVSDSFSSGMPPPSEPSSPA